MPDNHKFKIYLKTLSAEEIEVFFNSIDDELFEKLSTRIDIREYSEKLHEHALHFSLYHDSKLIGLAPCYFNSKNNGKAYLSALVLKKKYKGAGLKTKMLDLIKKHATKNGFKELLVSFHCDNTTSIKFYESNEFIKHTQNGHLCVFRFAQK